MKTAAHYQKMHRQRKKALGLVPVTVHIPPETRPALKACEAALQKGITPIIPDRVRSNEMERPAWTLETLFEALKNSQAVTNGQFDISPDPLEPCLRIRIADLGNTEAFIAVGGQQIVVSTLLVDADKLERHDELNTMLLFSNKVFPLSSFSLTTIDGHTYYELIGELSVYSPIGHVVEELDTLQDNIEEAIELISTYLKAQ